MKRWIGGRDVASIAASNCLTSQAQRQAIFCFYSPPNRIADDEEGISAPEDCDDPDDVANDVSNSHVIPPNRRAGWRLLLQVRKDRQGIS